MGGVRARERGIVPYGIIETDFVCFSQNTSLRGKQIGYYIENANAVGGRGGGDQKVTEIQGYIKYRGGTSLLWTLSFSQRCP